MKISELKKADLVMNLSGVLPNGDWNADFTSKDFDEAEIMNNKLVDDYRLRATAKVGTKNVKVVFAVGKFSYPKALAIEDTNDILMEGSYVVTDCVMLEAGKEYEMKEGTYTPDTNVIWGQMSKYRLEPKSSWSNASDNAVQQVATQPVTEKVEFV